MTRDIVIIGAGLAGSGLAAALSDLGWDVLLLERDRFPRHKVCGEFLSPEAQTTLQSLKLDAAVVGQRPVSIERVSLVSQRGRVVESPLPGPGWGLSRERLDHTLATAAQQRGVELWTETTVTRYEPCDNGYLVHATRQHKAVTIHTRVLIAACGRHTAAGLPPQASTRRRTQQGIGVKAHFEDLPAPATVELYFFPGGYVGVGPVEEGLVNVCLLAGYATFAGHAKQIPAMLDAVAKWNPAFGRRIAGGVLLPQTALAVAPVDAFRRATPWDGMGCVGDAAAMIPPLCGDGMAMALRSAEICAPLANAYLAGALTRNAWAALYSQQWQAEFAQRLRVGRALQRLLAAPGLAERLIRLGQVVPGLVKLLVRATRGAHP
jgi:menaquinone-9 beta-reductase